MQVSMEGYCGMKKEYSPDEFEELCRIMCTRQEICRVFGMTEDEMNEWCVAQYGKSFEEAHDVFSATGKVSLRRAQYKRATDPKKPSDVLLIWLGKNVLGQSDGAGQQNVSGTVTIVNDVPSGKVGSDDKGEAGK